jgi:hypothetical protein
MRHRLIKFAFGKNYISVLVVVYRLGALFPRPPPDFPPVVDGALLGRPRPLLPVFPPLPPLLPLLPFINTPYNTEKVLG